MHFYSKCEQALSKSCRLTKAVSNDTCDSEHERLCAHNVFVQTRFLV